MIENKEINRTFDKYPEYKYSGEYWMGDVPKHWDIKKLKHVFQEKKKVTNPNLNCGSISFGKVVYKDDDKIPESTKASYQEVLDGEFLINPLNLNYDLISLRIGLSDINVVVSSGYLVLKNVIKLNKFYFNYLLHRYDVAYMKLLGSGVRQTINFNHIANSMLAFPPLTEQTSIANFLDDKTSKIDTAIAQKEQMIALLKERKQIIIQNAVTGKWSMMNGEWSMTPREKMKDSGVEWIGEIPEEWEVKEIKYIKKNVKNAFVDGPFGSNLKSEHYIENGEVYVVESGFITTGVFINKTFKTISNKHFETIKRSSCEGGDVIIAKIGANYGMAAELPVLDKRAVVSGNSLKITLDDTKIKNNLFVKLLGLAKSLGGFEDIVNVSAQPALSLGGLNNLKLPIAPIKEQKDINKYIETTGYKHNQAITLQQSQIKKLKEYKATLIDSAVTGKIMVNG